MNEQEKKTVVAIKLSKDKIDIIDKIVQARKDILPSYSRTSYVHECVYECIKKDIKDIKDIKEEQQNNNDDDEYL